MARSADPTALPPLPLAAAIGLFGLAFAVIAAPWLTGTVTVPWDAKAQFQPQLMFLARTLSAGESPFWTGNVFAGWPQIADPQSLIFSPLYLAFAALDQSPSLRAADAVTFLALFIGGLGIIQIFRDRDWHVAGALVAALAFVAGGGAAARIQHTGEVASLAIMPIALWLTTRALKRESATTGAVAGLAAGLIAVGRDQVALLSLYLLAGAVIDHWLGGLYRLRPSVKPLLAAAVVAFAVAAVPVALTELLAAGSNRPAIDYASAAAGSLHPLHLITLAFADLYGAADPAVDYWAPPSMVWGSSGLVLAQNMGQIYAGALPLVALIAPGITRGFLFTRDIRFFTIALVITILYALGRYTPVFHLIYDLAPGVSFYRRPADATFLIGALVAVIGGYLVHRVLTGPLPPATVRQRGAALVLALAIPAAAITVAVVAGRLAVAVTPLLTGIAFAAAAAAALMLARRLADRQAWVAAILLLVFTTGDLAWNNAPNESTGLPPATYDMLRPDTGNATIALIKARLAGTASPQHRDRVELTGIGYPWPNAGLVHDIDVLFGLNPLRLKDYALATGVGDTVAVPEQRTFSPLFPSYRSTFADLLGLRFIATGVPVERIDRSLKPGDLTFIARTADAYVYENPRALPRVMLVPDYRVADFADMLGSGWPPEVDPQQTVLLEHPPQLPAATAASGSGPDIARIVSYRNTEVLIDVDAGAARFLVLNDAWHSWWRVTIDGTPAEILKANVLFRAVAIPPGHHRVAFTFHPFTGAAAELAARLGMGADAGR